MSPSEIRSPPPFAVPHLSISASQGGAFLWLNNPVNMNPNTSLHFGAKPRFAAQQSPWVLRFGSVWFGLGLLLAGEGAVILGVVSGGATFVITVRVLN